MARMASQITRIQKERVLARLTLNESFPMALAETYNNFRNIF